MAEIGVVLRETWRRFWPNTVLWGSLMLALLGFVLVALFCSALGPLGMIILWPAVWAYGAMVLSGLTGACAAAARCGRAGSEDFSRGSKLYFWRMFGLLGLYAATSAVVSLVVSRITGGSYVGALTQGSVDAFLFSRWFLVSQIIGFFTTGGILMLYGFAPAAIGFENTKTIDGIGNGLKYVGRRFGPVVGLLVAGLLLYMGPTLAIAWPIIRVSRLLAAAGASRVGSELAAQFSTLAWVLLPLVLYVCFAVPFIMLSFFVAYGRDRGLVGPIAPPPPPVARVSDISALRDKPGAAPAGPPAGPHAGKSGGPPKPPVAPPVGG